MAGAAFEPPAWMWLVGRESTSTQLVRRLVRLPASGRADERGRANKPRRAAANVAPGSFVRFCDAVMRESPLRPRGRVRPHPSVRIAAFND